MITFKIGMIEDISGFSSYEQEACVYYYNSGWFYNGLDGEDISISKPLAVMMIREMAEQVEVCRLNEFLKGIE